jgi:hypothetical protein
MGMITTQVDNYIAALQSYLATVVAAPTFTQAAMMTSKLNLFVTAEATFIQSFEGLAQITTNTIAFNANPLNADFNGLRTSFAADLATLISFPIQTDAFFKNQANAVKFAEYIVAAIAVSNRIKAGG